MVVVLFFMVESAVGGKVRKKMDGGGVFARHQEFGKKLNSTFYILQH